MSRGSWATLRAVGGSTSRGTGVTIVDHVGQRRTAPPSMQAWCILE
jgi:hypothetical protein